MTLQQLLLFSDIIVDDTGMGCRVEKLGPVIVSEEVHSHVDLLVEAVDFAERQGIGGV